MYWVGARTAGTVRSAGGRRSRGRPRSAPTDGRGSAQHRPLSVACGRMVNRTVTLYDARNIIASDWTTALSSLTASLGTSA